ncbi:MAG: TonB-dependent receptor plug domain-containing protein, partial [Rubrivivax sp.]
MSHKNSPLSAGRRLAAPRPRRLSPVLAAVAALLLAGTVHAQQSAGAITGQGSQGDVISIENKSINITRQIRVDSTGIWQASQLPPGIYTVTVTRAGGAKETIQVQVTAGQGALAAFSGVQSVTITGSALRTIDLSSVTSSYTLSKAEIERIPVPSNVTAVTLLSPGAVAGDGAFGNLASLGGASVAENAYYINGFNVTNILKGLAFNEVPFEAIGEVQVKNGGYSVEYGRSLGGVVAVNTKRGSNTWKSGAKLSISPAGLRASSVYAEKNASGTYDLINRAGTSESTVLSAYAGGPIIRDKLFVFGLIQGENSISNVYSQDNQTRTKVDTPKYLLKVDWNLNDNNLIELTAFNDKSKQKVDNFTAPSPYSGVRGKFLSTDSYTTGGENLIGKWTINLGSNLNISALAGQGKYSRANSIFGASCPAVYDGRPPRTTLQYLGCWSESAGLAVDDPNANDKRTAYRIDLEWTLGRHTIRAGMDNEVYDTVDGSQYTGGHYYRLFTLPAGRSIAG